MHRRWRRGRLVRGRRARRRRGRAARSAPRTTATSSVVSAAITASAVRASTLKRLEQRGEGDVRRDSEASARSGRRHARRAGRETASARARWRPPSCRRRTTPCGGPPNRWPARPLAPRRPASRRPVRRAPRARHRSRRAGSRRRGRWPTVNAGDRLRVHPPEGEGDDGEAGRIHLVAVVGRDQQRPLLAQSGSAAATAPCGRRARRRPARAARSPHGGSPARQVGNSAMRSATGCSSVSSDPYGTSASAARPCVASTRMPRPAASARASSITRVRPVPAAPQIVTLVVRPASARSSAAPITPPSAMPIGVAVAVVEEAVERRRLVGFVGRRCRRCRHRARDRHVVPAVVRSSPREGDAVSGELGVGQDLVARRCNGDAQLLGVAGVVDRELVEHELTAAALQTPHLPRSGRLPVRPCVARHRSCRRRSGRGGRARSHPASSPWTSGSNPAVA